MISASHTATSLASERAADASSTERSLDQRLAASAESSTAAALASARQRGAEAKTVVARLLDELKVALRAAPTPATADSVATLKKRTEAYRSEVDRLIAAYPTETGSAKIGIERASARLKEAGAALSTTDTASLRALTVAIRDLEIALEPATRRIPGYVKPLDYPEYVPTGYISHHAMVDNEDIAEARRQFEVALERLRADPTNPSYLAAYSTISKEYSTMTSAMAALPDNLQKQSDTIIRRL